MLCQWSCEQAIICCGPVFCWKSCLVCVQGLLRLNVSSHQLEQLTSTVSADSPEGPDSPIFYANSLDIAPNGSIYFTSSTDILPARARDGSYDTGFAWALNNFRGTAA